MNIEHGGEGRHVGGAGFREPEKNPRITDVFDRYNPGDYVFVNVEGRIEDGWKFSHRSLDTGNIVVVREDIREDNRVKIHKEIPVSEFIAAQNEGAKQQMEFIKSKRDEKI